MEYLPFFQPHLRLQITPYLDLVSGGTADRTGELSQALRYLEKAMG